MNERLARLDEYEQDDDEDYYDDELEAYGYYDDDFDDDLAPLRGSVVDDPATPPEFGDFELGS
jgi:hypothetical protein